MHLRSPTRLAALCAAFLCAVTAALAQSSPIPCPDFGSAGPAWEWRLRAYAGGGQTDQDYAVPEALLIPYRGIRDASEELLITPRGGLRAEVSHPSGLSARIGVDYHLYRTVTRASRLVSAEADSLVEVRTPTGELIRTDTFRVAAVEQTEIYNRHQTVALGGGIGFHRWFGRVAPYVYAEVGYEFRVATRGALFAPALTPNPNDPADPTLAFTLVESEGFIAEAPGLQYGGTAGVDIALGDAWFVGPSVSYTVLAGLGSDAEPLAYEQTALTAALSLGLRF